MNDPRLRFWLSWVQPTEDHRPLTYPPNEAIIGWWCSGYTPEDHATICALVEAVDEEGAKLAVLKDWPEAGEWRFCEQFGLSWQPNDRFPLSDWMQERIQR